MYMYMYILTTWTFALMVASMGQVIMRWVWPGKKVVIFKRSGLHLETAAVTVSLVVVEERQSFEMSFSSLEKVFSNISTSSNTLI